MFTTRDTGSPTLPSSARSATRADTSLVRRFARDDNGNIAIIFGLTTFIVCAMVGGAIDVGRWVSARNQTQAAIDSALLAAGRTAQTTYGDATASINAAKAYYKQMKSNLVIDDTITFVANNTATTFTASGSAKISTPFLQFACPQIMPGCHNNPLSSLPVVNLADGKRSESTIAQNGNSGSSVEIGLMLDTTGSMSGQKITDLKAAANDLVDIVVWADQSKYTSRIGIAPFASTVNVGDYFQAVTNQNPNLVTHTETTRTGTTYTYGYPASCYKSDGKLKSECKNDSKYITGSTPVYTTTTIVDNPAKAKCVVERTGNHELAETSPGAGSWVTSYYDAMIAQGVNNPSTTCPESSLLVPLTSNKQMLKSTINAMVATGSTAGAVGTAWAWYLISPQWGTIFTGDAKPDSYSKLTELGPSGQPRLRKIAILMTDGAYNTYQAKMFSDTSSDADAVRARATSLCTNMKAQGIIVYTIGFQLGTDARAISTLNSCATDATYFYNAATGDALKAAFRDIALKISALRISH
jgi:Flp pilus assembly protein TadG